MEAFSVKTSSLKSTSNEFKNISKKLEQYAGDISAVRRGLNSSNFSQQTLLNNLRVAISNLNDLAYKTKLMKNCVVNVTERYIDADKKAKDIINDKKINWKQFINEISSGSSKWSKVLSKLFNDKGGILGLFGAVTGVVGSVTNKHTPSGLLGTILGTAKSGTGVTSGILKLMKNKWMKDVDDFDKGIGEYLYEKGHPNLVKIGGTLSVLGDILGMGKTSADYIMDDNKNSDKTFKFVGDMVVGGIKLAGDAVKAKKYSDKIIKFAADGTAKYALSEGAKQTIGKATVVVTVAELAWGGIKGGYNEFKEVYSDGHISGADVGKIATHTLAGVGTEAVSILTFGLVKPDTKAAGNYMYDVFTGEKTFNDVKADAVSSVSNTANKIYSLTKDAWSSITKLVT